MKPQLMVCFSVSKYEHYHYHYIISIIIVTTIKTQLTVSQEVVELHGAVVDGVFLGQHAVDVQHLHVQPGEGSHVEVM